MTSRDDGPVRPVDAERNASEILQELIGRLSGRGVSGWTYRFLGTGGAPEGAVSALIAIDRPGRPSVTVAVELAPLSAPASESPVPAPGGERH